MINAPPTILEPSRRPAPGQVPGVPPANVGSTPPTTLGVLQQIEYDLRVVRQLLTPLPTVDVPQGMLVIEPSGGGVNSKAFRRWAANLVLEVYSSGTTPSATITVLDNAIGGTPTQAIDPLSLRVLTSSYAKYVVQGVQDEVTIKLAPTAGIWSVWASFTDGSPGTTTRPKATWNLTQDSGANSLQTLTKAGVAGVSHYLSAYSVTVSAAAVGASDASILIQDNGATIWKDFLGAAAVRGTRVGNNWVDPLQISLGNSVQVVVAAAGAAAVTTANMSGYSQ